MDRCGQTISYLATAAAGGALLWWGYDIVLGGFEWEKALWVGFFTVLMIGTWATRPRGPRGRLAGIDLHERGVAALDQIDDDRPLVSIVLLLRQPRDIDGPTVAEMAHRAWASDEPQKHQERPVVMGAAPSFVVKMAGRSFLVNSFAMPYFPDPQHTADEMAEVRLKKIVAEHRGWISVDLLDAAGQEDLEQAYQWIGKLIAELADEDALAIFSPATGRINVFDPQMRPKLCGQQPLELFDRPASPPVLRVAGDDPRMVAAVQEARRRWDEFVAAYEKEEGGRHFSVKSAFTDGTHTEYMWLGVTAIENGVIYGKLGNTPVNVHGLNQGDVVKVKVEDVNDWMYLDEGRVRGGFTIELIRKVGHAGKQGA